MINHFSGSYDPADVQFLLTPLDLPTISIAEKETLLRGHRRHYSEVLSAEAPPSAQYLAAYHAALAANGARLARDIASLAAALARRPVSPAGLALVSFARAGTPIGVLLRRALARAGRAAPHYSISIVRDRGIDPTALDHILARHAASDLVFVDGWTGKGAIAREMRNSAELAARDINPALVVIADPAGQADLAATADDYVIPSGILNGIISGLVSRSVIIPDAPPGQFHACRALPELAEHDLSRAFVDLIDRLAEQIGPVPPADWPQAQRTERAAACARMIARLSADHAITDINHIKPGVAEATRAVLRREPRAVLVSGEADAA
ncbi:MAG: hypothetical protein J0M19_13600, partial [Sphingomonadales bacterium]|nr:hypothetical protein [Sphingomonadales bacterium]